MNYFAEIHASDPFGPQAGNDPYHYEEKAKPKKEIEEQMHAAANRARQQILKEKLAHQQEILNNAMLTEQ